MASIRNIVKILRDSDVKVSRKEDSLKTVHAAAIARLDLRFTEGDIDDIRRDGVASLESGYPEGIAENLLLLAELLGYREPPAAFRIPHHAIYGATYRRDSGEEVFGPAVIFNRMRNDLRLTEEQFGSREKERIERFHRIAGGKEEPTAAGPAVFGRLKAAVMRSRAAGN
jgi:hypothetical protein